MSPKQVLISTLIFLVLLTSSFFAFHELSQPITDYNAITHIYGLKKLNRDDIMSKFLKEKTNGKPILLINPIRIAERIKRNPLVACVHIKRFLYPERKIKIYIKEAKLWARYGSKIFNADAKYIANMAKIPSGTRVHKLLNSYNYVEIKSPHALSDDDLKLLLKLSKLIEKSTRSRVSRIEGDRDKNFCIATNHYIFKIGLLDKTALKRTERVTLVLDQLRTIDKNKTELEYIDLSLSSSQVILGRKLITNQNAEPSSKLAGANKPQDLKPTNKTAVNKTIASPKAAPKAKPKPVTL